MAIIEIKRPDSETILHISSAEGLSLLEAMRACDELQLDAPCGGNGRCGRCRVRVSGAVSPRSEAELKLLTCNGDDRLACMTEVLGDCTVELASSDGIIVSTAPAMRKADTLSRYGLGAAVDLGTTTVVVRTLELETGNPLSTVSALNRQRAYGGDVITRIQYVMENDRGLETLQDEARGQINELISSALTQIGGSAAKLSEISIAGNSIMQHIFAGIDPRSIASAPFTPAEYFGCELDAAFLGLAAADGACVYLSPCVSGYVGGDITAGLSAIDALSLEDKVLFIDIGTNGEMAVGSKSGYCCCSTAAGPAFEGGSISCGMSAVAGAVDKVWLEDGRLCYSVLGGGKASGICGSGLVDILAVLLELGLVDETGRLLSHDEANSAYAERLVEARQGTAFRLTDGVELTAADIRKLQLAKAAVAAGIQTLMRETASNYADISALYIAGGFGNYLRAESAVRIGLLPKELLSKVRAIGNSSLAGAALFLLSDKERQAGQEIAKRCRYIELSVDPQFGDAFVDCMMFE